MLYLAYVIATLVGAAAMPSGCGEAAQPAAAPLVAPQEAGEQTATTEAVAEPGPTAAATDVAVAMDPPPEDPDGPLVDDPDPVGSSWVAEGPGGELPEDNTALIAPLNLTARDVGDEESVRLRWSVESANQLAFMIQRQHWWGEVWVDSEMIVAPPFPYEYTDRPGAGLWRYRVAAANEDGTSSPTDWAEVRVTSSWTTFTPSADTRIVYVSSSEGNDANDGLSPFTPKATIAAGYALLRHGYPDWLLLKRGDVWDESLGHWKKSGRSATEMMVVNTYGDAVARPLLRVSGTHGLSRIQGGGSPLQVDNVALVGLHLLATAREPATSNAGIYLLDGGDNWLIEDCTVEGFGTNINIQNFRGIFRNIVLFRCIVLNAHNCPSHSSGIYVDGPEGFVIDECLVDQNGFHAGVCPPTVFNHGIYIQTSTPNAIVRNSLIARSASHGLQLRGGGEVVGCVFIRNPIALLAGGGDSPVVAGVTVLVEDNIILEGTDITAVLPRGYGIDLKNIRGGRVRNNVIANKLTTNIGFAIGSWVSGGPPGVGIHDLTIEHNLVHNWRGGLTFNSQSPGTYAGIVVQGNNFQSLLPADSASLVTSSTVFDGFRFGGNKYFAGSNPSPFRHYAASMTFAAWRDLVAETDSAVEQTPLPDGLRSIESLYSQITGSPHDLDSTLAALREQSRNSWDPRLTMTAIRAYLADGFEIAR